MLNYIMSYNYYNNLIELDIQSITKNNNNNIFGGIKIKKKKKFKNKDKNKNKNKNKNNTYKNMKKSLYRISKLLDL